MVGLQTSHRYGNATLLESDLVLGIGNRWANRTPAASRSIPKVAASSMSTSNRPRSAGCSCPMHRLRRRRRPRRIPRSGPRVEGRRQAEVARRLAGKLPAAQTHAAAQDPLRQRAGETAARLRRDERVLRQGCLLRQHHRPVADRRRTVPPCLPAAPLDQSRGQAGRWAGPFPPRWEVKADPSRQVVALSGDYDFQFMIEELAVGAQFAAHIHVLVNNSYLGLIRQSSAASIWTLRSWPSTTSTPPS